MSTPILICDDSNMARKQIARCLPADWDVEISFAENGQQAIDVITMQQVDVLFLDLNMPVLDGYGVLKAIKTLDLPTLTIVVSGDIQPAAYERVMSLGALDFIHKPIDRDKLAAILHKSGLKSDNERVALEASKIEDTLDEQLRDIFQELTNVAMGQAGDLLARLLSVFVKLPIPNVNVMEVSELHMALQSIEHNQATSGVCQGFIGSGVSGEALLILNDSSFKDIASLLNYQGDLSDDIQLELLMDVGNILIGAILKGLAEQLAMQFSQGHPVILGQHANVSELILANVTKWRRALTIEVSYGIENYDISCDLLLVFTEESIATLRNKVNYLLTS